MIRNVFVQTKKYYINKVRYWSLYNQRISHGSITGYTKRYLTLFIDEDSSDYFTM